MDLKIEDLIQSLMEELGVSTLDFHSYSYIYIYIYILILKEYEFAG